MGRGRALKTKAREEYELTKARVRAELDANNEYERKHASKFDLTKLWTSVSTHIGKITDKLTADEVIDLGRVAAIVSPFVLADRKTGGSGVEGLLAGLLAERLIKDQINLPQVTVLGTTVQVNAGYAMLAPTLAFLGLNRVGFYNAANSVMEAAGLAGQGARDALETQERAYQEMERIKKDPTSTDADKILATERYFESKVYRK